MKYSKYVILALRILALAALVIAGIYASYYFAQKREAVRLQDQEATQKSDSAQSQNKEAAQEAALYKPTISFDGISCNFAPDAKIRNYSVTIRTANAAIPMWQRQAEDLINSRGGTISVSNQGGLYDSSLQATLASAVVFATMPMDGVSDFVARLRSQIVAPDYLQNESYNTQTGYSLRQMCEANLESIKNARDSEILYLNQLKAASSAQSYATEKIIKDLSDLRKTASAIKGAIDSILDNINNKKAGITITITEFPG